jgi:hypothetical protein
MLAYLFVLLAVAIRFLPHPFAFTPVGASLLFFGASAPRKRAWIPLAALAASDVVLTHWVYAYPFSLDHFATWAWYAAVLGLGMLLGAKVSPARVLGASLATAVSFFAISNFAVWLAWNMYPPTLSGLMASYVAAIPFFRNELVSDVLFSAVFFSIPALVKMLKGATAENRIPA